MDVVANGGFEIDSAWEIPGTAYPARYSTAQARNGSRSMQVGIVESAEDEYSFFRLDGGSALGFARLWFRVAPEGLEVHFTGGVPEERQGRQRHPEGDSAQD